MTLYRPVIQKQKIQIECGAGYVGIKRLLFQIQDSTGKGIIRGRQKECQCLLYTNCEFVQCASRDHSSEQRRSLIDRI